jgi:hypothetical protein
MGNLSKEEYVMEKPDKFELVFVGEVEGPEELMNAVDFISQFNQFDKEEYVCSNFGDRIRFYEKEEKDPEVFQQEMENYEQYSANTQLAVSAAAARKFFAGVETIDLNRTISKLKSRLSNIQNNPKIPENVKLVRIKEFTSELKQVTQKFQHNKEIVNQLSDLIEKLAVEKKLLEMDSALVADCCEFK